MKIRKDEQAYWTRLLASAVCLAATGGALAKPGGVANDIVEIREAVAANSAAIEENAAAIEQTEAAITANGATIAANANAIGANQAATLVNAAGIATNAAAIGQTQEDVDLVDQRIAELDLMLQSAGELMLQLDKRTERLRKHSRTTRRWIRAMAAARVQESQAVEARMIQLALDSGLGPQELDGDYWVLWLKRAMDIVEHTRCNVSDEDGLYPELARGDLDCELFDGTSAEPPVGEEDGVIMSREETSFALKETVVTLELQVESTLADMAASFPEKGGPGSYPPACRDYMIRFYDTHGRVMPPDNDQGEIDSYLQCVAAFNYPANQVYLVKDRVQNSVQDAIEVIVLGEGASEVVEQCEVDLFDNVDALDDSCAAHDAALVDAWETIKIKGEKPIEKETDCYLSSYLILGMDGNGCALNEE